MIEPYAEDPGAAPAYPPVNPTAARPQPHVPNALKDFPYVGHTGPVDQFIPLYAPIRDGIAYYQDGDYGSAAVSAAQALLDAATLVPGVGAARMATQVVGAANRARLAKLAIGWNQKKIPPSAWQKPAPTSKQARDLLAAAGLVKPGYQVHHIVPLKGMKRNIPAIRNHPALLNPMPTSSHQRLTGRSGALPKYNAVERLWYGTNIGMKAGAAGTAAVGYIRRWRNNPEAWFSSEAVDAEKGIWMEADEVAELEIKKLQAMTSIAEFCVYLGDSTD